MRAIELSCAGIDCARFDRAGQIIHCQTAHSQRRRIGFDSNRALHSVNVHLRNTWQNVDPLCDNRGRVLI